MGTLYGTDSGETLRGGTDSDTIYGYGGDDLLDSGEPSTDPFAYNYDALYGGRGNDTLLLRTPGGFASGESGDDELRALAEYADLFGGAGNDLLVGFDNDAATYDRFAGLVYSERLDPGTGADTIVSGSGWDHVLLDQYDVGLFEISDFSALDTIRIEGLTLTRAAVTVDGAGTISIDLDGDFAAERVIRTGGVPAGASLYVDASVSQYGGRTVIGFESSTALTVTGTSGADHHRGGAFADNLSGRGGADVFVGRGGNDTLVGGEGSDILIGGDGNDLIRGGHVAGTASDPATDQLIGGAGNDTIYAADYDLALEDIWRADTFIDGGEGNDRLYGSSAWDSFQDSGGSDLVVGGGGYDDYYLNMSGRADAQVLIVDGNVIIENHDHRDTLEGIESVRLAGGLGDDVLVARSLPDLEPIDGRPVQASVSMEGGLGSNFLDASNVYTASLSADGDNDTLIGGAGDDLISIRDGIVVTGAGVDTVYLSSLYQDGSITLTDFGVEDRMFFYVDAPISTPQVVIDANGATLEFDVSLFATTTVRFEGRYDGRFDIAVDGQSYEVRFIGTYEQTDFYGGYGDDEMMGSDEADHLEGFAGDDLLTGGLGADVIYGGSGADVIYGDGGA